jgi:predicted amidohydrolase
MEWSERAANQGCSLAVFPELSLVGYPPKDLLERPSFIRENLRRVDMLAEQIKSISVLFGYVDMNPNFTGKPLLNCVALIRNGKIAGKGGKRLLPAYDVFDETR